MTPIFTVISSKFPGVWYVQESALRRVVMSGTLGQATEYARSHACDISQQIDATVHIHIEKQGTFAVRMRKVG